MVVMESVTLLVKPEVAEDGTRETERVKSSGLSAVQVREKDASGSMLYLLFFPSITLSEEWREAMGGVLRSAVKSREPVGERGHTLSRAPNPVSLENENRTWPIARVGHGHGTWPNLAELPTTLGELVRKLTPFPDVGHS